MGVAAKVVVQVFSLGQVDANLLSEFLIYCILVLKVELPLNQVSAGPVKPASMAGLTLLT